MKTNKIMGIYIHIPFCIKKCNYCDFLSFTADDLSKEAYINALINKIKYYGEKYNDYHISTVFIGGGTPSVLIPGAINRIMTALHTFFQMEECSEITIECNPGTVTDEKLSEYINSGINRISFGLQSTNNNELKYLGRIHTYDLFLDSYELARKAGFKNINIDLMSALPYQTIDSYCSTLNDVLSLRPEHISAYSLIIEEGTPFSNISASLLPDEDTEREMYHLTKTILKNAGYDRYEISNYSLKGYECNHNISYWKRINYLGIGLGSSSLLRKDYCYTNTAILKNVRFTETKDMNKFINSKGNTISDSSVLSLKEIIEEYIFLGLRLTAGISADDFYQTFKINLYDLYSKEIDYLKNLNVITFSNNILKFTDYGFDISNTALTYFLDPNIEFFL